MLRNHRRFERITKLAGRLLPSLLAVAVGLSQTSLTARPAQGVNASKLSPGKTTNDSSQKPGSKVGQPPIMPGQYSVYSQQQSRRIFAACDLNGDDQISYLEAIKTFISHAGRKQFHRLDTNRDAVLSFDEFDKNFKTLTSRGLELGIRGPALERLPLSVDSNISKDPRLLTFFAKLDADGNDRINFAEWKVLGGMPGENPAAVFNQLDKDLSSTLSLEELVPFAKSFALLANTKIKTYRLRPLPEAVRAVDRDSDGLLRKNELERALARIHPSLLKHAARIFLHADLNGDGALDPIEIGKALERGP